VSPGRAARLGAVAAGFLACSGAAPAQPPPPPPPSRYEYAAFRAAHPGLLEPNYLPFMATPVRVESSVERAVRRLRGALGAPAPRPPETLVLCRWPDEAFPLAVFVAPPAIPAELAEQRPDARSPADYAAAAERALRTFERDLEGLVRFERAASERDAELTLRLSAEPVAEGDPDVEVLGTTPLGGACRVEGGDPASGRLDVSFSVRELRVRVADQYGLLLPEQVERIALHELGHALGMRAHSPIPADLMYPVVRDRLPRGELGTEDVNSFLSLYSLPNGTVLRAAGAPPRPAPPPHPGPPALELAPHVDARLGFEIQLPRGWTRLDTGLGLVAVDGTTWDYEASLQVIVREAGGVDAYLERYGEWHLGHGRIVEASASELAGHPARRFALESPDGAAEGLALIEAGAGRVVVVLWDCPQERAAAFRPWFEASLATLELRPRAGTARDRDYSGGGP
jgi:hypothetical protein